RYAIWGAGIVSPCDGVVASAVDGLPDHPVGLLHEENPAGNHVVVRCSGVDITLAHMMSGSVTVRGGEGIAKGQPLGRVGNSGNTTEPHLHVHGERNGDAVALRFDRRWLVRNGVVRRP
ncbi:MAG TPA: M23 family metallopeptidase, partial [Thermoanaerobaculia bacterium]